MSERLKPTRILDFEDVRKRRGCSKATLERDLAEGRFPPASYDGQRRVWSEEEVEEALRRILATKTPPPRDFRKRQRLVAA